MSKYLSEDFQKSLRQQGVIGENEVVAKQGDIYVAINVITSTRRVLSLDQAVLNENSKRVLKG